MRWACAWLPAVGLLGCGTPANPPASTSAGQVAVSTTGGETAEPKPADEEQPPNVTASPQTEPSVPPPPPPVSASLGEPGQPVPTVSGVLPPLPTPSLAVVVTLQKLEVGEVSVALEAGLLPSPASPPQTIVDAINASEGPVAWVIDAGVPATTLHALLGVLPPERARALVMQTPKGKQGAVGLATSVPADVPQVRIAPDGLHIAEQPNGKEYDLGPDPAGDTFNYVELRNKAKSFRTKNPQATGVRVLVDEGVTVEVLARAISQIRGPKCSVEPRRCWLPDVAFGPAVETTSTKSKIEFSKPSGASGAPGTVEISKAKVGKGVDASKVDAVLKRRAGFARMCYFAALADAPKLAGTMDLRLTLGKDGKVIEVGVPESSLDDDAVEACLTRGLGGLRFAAPESAPVAVDVSLTFKLR